MNNKKKSSYGYYVMSSLNEKNRKIIFAYVSEHCASSGTKNLILRGAVSIIKKCFKFCFLFLKIIQNCLQRMHNFYFKSDEKICRVYRDGQIDHISKT